MILNLRSNHGRRQKNFCWGGQWKNQDREIAPISLPLLLYQWRVKVRTGHTPRAHLEESLQSPQGSAAEPRIKIEGLFWRNAHFRENDYLFIKFQAIFVRKKKLHTELHLSLITPAC